MTWRKKHRPRPELDAIVQRFRTTPLRLPPHLVSALLNEICDLGVCLTPNDYGAVEANPPTDPLTFAELVVRLEGGGIDSPESVNTILDQIVSTFEGAERASRQ